MRFLLILITTCPLLAGFILFSQEDQPAKDPLEDLSWMAGHWEGEDQGVRMEEVWLEPRGGLMVGMHRDVFPSGGSFFEFLRISVSEKGIAYFASPRGARATAFSLKEVTGKKAVFENKDHDFPQRILYWREGDALFARIEGVQGGEARSSQWVWNLRSEG